MNEVSPPDAFDRLYSAQFVDVREDEEVAAGMIPGAEHIPLGELQQRVSELDPASPVITVCRSGRRSLKAAQTLEEAGLTAESMSGGMEQWVAEGHPAVRP